MLGMSKTTITIWVFSMLATISVVYLSMNRPRNIVLEGSVAVDFPVAGFSHAQFEDLLLDYVTEDGRVNYDQWHSSADSRTSLDDYLAAVSEYSPDNAPDRFPSRNDELAYWIYGYNAYVIRTVLDNWPINSVTDLKAPIEVVKGLGFFHRLRFSFGGDYLSLLAVENRKIRKQYKDARIHFVLNCASESCPIARPELPTGSGLEQLLTRAATEFVNDPSNVQVDHLNKTVYLSSIFKWYKEDFLQDLRLIEEPVNAGLVGYAAAYASGEQSIDLAKAGEYAVEFRVYDWSLNQQKP